MIHFITAFLAFAAYDMILAYVLHKEVPGLTIPDNWSAKSFWKYHAIRLFIVSALLITVWYIFEF